MAIIRKRPSSRMTVQFWGVRGTLPVPGQHSLRYGGNTNCVTLKTDDGHFLIFDAGTGIKMLSDFLVEKKQLPLKATLLISHPHYDHINGLPFFLPLYMPENQIQILGGMHGAMDIHTLLSGQMDNVYFPVTMGEFAAHLTFRTLKEETISLGAGMTVSTIFLDHPGGSLGYRVDWKRQSFCYLTDNEFYPEHSRFYDQKKIERLVEFMQGASFVVMDTTYTEEEYIAKIGWGHSSVGRAVALIERARVKQFCLFHHDPGQMDEDIDRKYREVRKILKAHQSKTCCVTAKEGDVIVIGSS